MKDTEIFAPVSYEHLRRTFPSLIIDFANFLFTEAGALDSTVYKFHKQLTPAEYEAVGVHIEDLNFDYFDSLCRDRQLDTAKIVDTISTHNLLHPVINNISDLLVNKDVFSYYHINAYLQHVVLHSECLATPILVNAIRDSGYTIDQLGWVQTRLLGFTGKNIKLPVKDCDYSFCLQLRSKRSDRRLMLQLSTVDGRVRYTISNYDLIFPASMTITKLLDWLRQKSNENEKISYNLEGHPSQFKGNTVQFSK